MASETVDPIDLSHAPSSWAVPPERLVLSINRCSLSSTGNRPCNFSMRGNHLAYAATQGILALVPVLNGGCFSVTLHIVDLWQYCVCRILHKIWCNPMHHMYGALPVSYVPVRATNCALVAHRTVYLCASSL